MVNTPDTIPIGNGRARVILTIRVTPPARDYVDQLAELNGLDRSEVSRRLLAIGTQHLPREWKRP